MAEFKFGFNVDIDHQKFTQIVDAIKVERDEGISGYFQLPYDTNIVNEVREYCANTSFVQNATQVAVVGIGGSSLGTKAIKALLEHKADVTKEMIFFENSDPIDIDKKLDKLDKNRCVIVLISKSGTTIETISIFKTILHRLQIDLAKENQHIVAITDGGSPLDHFAKEFAIKTFEIAPNVGGRFSVMSAVGVVPLFLSGYDVDALLLGAKEQTDQFFNYESKSLVQKAWYYVQNKEKFPINVVFAYGSVLKSFVKWYIQLWGESLGKINRSQQSVGFTPVGLIGSVDQHSFLQLIVDGPKDKTVTFIRIKNFEDPLPIPQMSLKYLEKTDYINAQSFQTLINSQAEATMQSLQELNIATDLIEIESLHEMEVGRLMAYYELLTSVSGHLLNINTYDQPGVEQGKKILQGMFND